ncbi:MAG: peptide chain release factor-like protein [Deltaproteobacteria bacterium]|jgi:protein subunit release factor B|nr:peptide chain release factor-like protein [Deltaproteobacteria bacterium]MBW2519246.1 peptide chain release factor-like protein [Deltaproteobacteria bacterium]
MKSKDIRIDFYRGSGPGGQHRNTSETGVRITHVTTGLVAIATESRSRRLNLQRAMARLEAKLADYNRPSRSVRLPSKPTRASIKRRLDRKKQQSEKKRSRQRIKP